MKKFTFLVLVTILFACTPKNNIPDYFNINKTDIEIHNLYGKVKSVKVYLSEPQKEDEFSRMLRHKGTMEFNESGGLIKNEQMTLPGALEKLEENTFDDNNRKIRSEIKDFIFLKHTVEDIVYKDNLISHKFMSKPKADTFKLIYDYNENGKKEKETVYSLKDNKIVKVSDFTYTPNGKPKQKELIMGDSLKNRIISKYEYNEKDQLVKITNIYENGAHVSNTKYKYDKKGYLIEKSYFRDDIIVGRTVYDRKYNEIYKASYDFGEIKEELNFEYKYDKNGNWIYGEVLQKENSLDEKSYRVVKKYTRKIEYF